MGNEKIIAQLIKSIANLGLDRITLRPGEVVIREGDDSNQVFFLLSGQLSVWLKGTRLNCINSGEIFGELAFLMNTERTATIIADQKSEIVVFPRSLIEKTLSYQPAWLQIYINSLMNKVLLLSQEVSNCEFNRKNLIKNIKNNDTVLFHLKKIFEIIFK